MNNVILFLIVGLSYVAIFGGLSYLRREGLSMQFAFESLLLTGFIIAIMWYSRTSLNPAVFLFALYLITMRVRLCVEMGTYYAKRKDFQQADRFYTLASRLMPDASAKLVINLNQAISKLQRGDIQSAINELTDVLSSENREHLGAKYESAAHYNLGLAYLRSGMDAQGIVEFNRAIESFPTSEYARQAARAIEIRQRPKNNT